jgi:tetratricopeptide (TPR) repeat protein
MPNQRRKVTFIANVCLLAALVAWRAAFAVPRPLAILTDVRGAVQVVQEGRSGAGRSGTQLFAGDTVRVTQGSAKVYYLSRPPQVLGAGQATKVVPPGAAQGPAVWRTVYAGISTGFSRRGEKRYATVRNEVQIQLIAPVATQVTGPRPYFLWLPPLQTAYISDYQVQVREAGKVLWQGASVATTVHYPKTAPVLQPGHTYTWTVVPRRKTDQGKFEPDTDQQSAEANFQLAAAATTNIVLYDLAQLKPALSGLPTATQRLAVAATYAQHNLYAEAIESLLLRSEPATTGTALTGGTAQFYDLNAATLLLDEASRSFLGDLLARGKNSTLQNRFNGYVAVAELEAEYAGAAAALEQTKPGSAERAAAAQEAAAKAGDLAFAAFDARLFSRAFDWLNKRADLRKEAYSCARNVLETEAKAGAAERAELRRQFEAVAPGQTKVNLELKCYMASNRQWMRLAKLYKLAGENNDPAAQSIYAQGELEVQRGDLEILKIQEAPPEMLDFKRAQIARALDELGNAQTSLFRFDEARKTFDEELTLRRSLPAATTERRVDRALESLGGLYLYEGDMPRARDYYEQALAALEQTGPAPQPPGGVAADPRVELLRQAEIVTEKAMILNNLGSVTDGLGDYTRSQVSYTKALNLLATLPAQGEMANIRVSMEATTKSNLAEVHAAIGDPDGAIQQWHDAIAMHRAIDEVEYTGAPLMSIANAYFERGDNEQARQYTEQARLIFQLTQNFRSLVTADSALSVLARQTHDFTQAAAYADECVAVAQKTGDYGLLASSARTLAGLRVAQQKYADALQVLDGALAADAHSGSPLSRASTLHWRGRALEGLGRDADALAAYRTAIDLNESVRAMAPAVASFAERELSYQLYRSIVQLLIKLQRPEEAFDYLTRAKSQKLRENLRLSSIKSNNKELQQLLERASGLQNKLRSYGSQLETEQAKPAAARDTSRVQNLQLVLADTQREFILVSKQIESANPNFDKILSVRPAELKQAQQSIPQDTIFVQYAPLGDTLYIFLVTRDKLKIVKAAASPAAVEKSIAEFRTLIGESLRAAAGGHPVALTSWDSSDAATVALRHKLTGLYAMLVTPIEKEIADKQVLALIPTGSFYYLPLHALAKEQDGKLRFLIEDKQVVYLTAADVMAVVQQHNSEQRGKGLTAYGNPAGAGLAHAQQEVDTIARLMPDAAVISGAQVTKQTVLAPQNLSRRYLHFATHGVLNALAPDQSYIQLAANTVPEESRLTVGEVYGLDLNKVDLVTLSACQTALGERNPDGREITTLADAFATAGAATVTASLWSVDDTSTEELMVEFYRQLAAGKSKAAAMQSAQLKVMHEPQYRHPFYWAPFILMGDWR